MSPGPLAAVAALTTAFAAWELAGLWEGRRRRAGRRGAAERMLDLLAVERRIAGAGLEGRIRPITVGLAHPVGALLGALAAQVAAPAAPARLGLALFAVLPLAGFLAPRVALERAARRRLERAEATLPDVLDLVAAALGAGRSIGSALAASAGSGSGVLACELRSVACDIGSGVPVSDSLRRLEDRLPTAGLRSFSTVIRRAQRLGTPLADQLRELAESSRSGRAVAVAERASRAAPKIQLVVALVLVPSVLLLIGAALAANADAFFAGL